jgi:predicted transcriptional regulator
MPWAPNDADRHKKGLSQASKAQWAAIANKVLMETGSDKQAIKAANGATRSAVKRYLKKKTGVGGFDG